MGSPMSVRIPLPTAVPYLFRVIHDQLLLAPGEYPIAGTNLRAVTGIIVTVARATGDD
jgi:hypothetical protein